MSAASDKPLFKNEVVRVIWDEVKRAAQEDHYVGVAVDDPYSIRGASWVSYAIDEGCYMYQNGRSYRTELWSDFCLLFQLLQRIGNAAACSEMVLWRVESRPTNDNRVKLTFFFRGRCAHAGGVDFAEKCLVRADEVMTMLDKPLN